MSLEPGISPAVGAARGLQLVLRRLLRPMARLALARGLQHRNIDASLRWVMVQEARQVLGAGRRHGLVSRISTATGLTRRDVARLLQADAAPRNAPRSLAGEVFTRWRSDPACPKAGLPRSGEAPSFDALARSVTRDVHPRSLLDELCRLGLACVDEAQDRVSLLETAFVPSADAGQMMTLLGDNVSDHFSAAVSNVLGRGDAHFEQALYADELSEASVRALRPRIAAEWARLFEHMAPLLEQQLADDRAQGRPRTQRVRIGFYSFAEPMDADAADTTPARGAEPQGSASRAGDPAPVIKADAVPMPTSSSSRTRGGRS